LLPHLIHPQQECLAKPRQADQRVPVEQPIQQGSLEVKKCVAIAIGIPTPVNQEPILVSAVVSLIQAVVRFI
jgi:hypothetical protein